MRVRILLLKFHLNGSSGSLTPTNDKEENAIFYIYQKPTKLKIYITKETNKMNKKPYFYLKKKEKNPQV